MLGFFSPASSSHFSADLEAVFCKYQSNWDKIFASGGKKCFHVISRGGIREQGFSYDAKNMIRLYLSFMSLLQSLIWW